MIRAQFAHPSEFMGSHPHKFAIDFHHFDNSNIPWVGRDRIIMEIKTDNTFNLNHLNKVQ